LEELKPISNDPVIQDIVRTVWHYLVYSATYTERDYGILHEIINSIVEVETMPTTFEKWSAERKSVWQADAVVKDRAEMILKILQARFNKVPNETEKTIRQMTDPIALDSWAVQAATCQSMDEFAEALK